MSITRSLLFALIIFAITGFLNLSSSQTIYFCEDVDNNGEPINESSQFTIPSNGGYLYVLVQLWDEADCETFNLEIFRNDRYENTLSVSTKSNWSFFWKQVTFYKSGEYTVDVYDCNDELVTSGTVTIDKE
ncbi:MAG: hypothetical protein IT276_06290 [Ignavibacteriaceae bacterium]|nr:hypothetical protein [Ignavibacteriaceae bacterium]HRN25517.1 hypothetical protein [Ignavibacteriaceae bacterium]HRP94477.1 hypothetical protein [Ignavibacteriaceae bacterium]HRQ53515.1 hypothetical protein [Ignavibacteriaceae bacterium]